MKYALIIGMNYPNSDNPLKGCVNDARDVHAFLKGRGYDALTLMTDDPVVALLTSLQKLTPESRWRDLVVQLRQLLLDSGYRQVPQLDVGRQDLIGLAVDL